MMADVKLPLATAVQVALPSHPKKLKKHYCVLDADRLCIYESEKKYKLKKGEKFSVDLADVFNVNKMNSTRFKCELCCVFSASQCAQIRCDGDAATDALHEAAVQAVLAKRLHLAPKHLLMFEHCFDVCICKVPPNQRAVLDADQHQGQQAPSDLSDQLPNILGPRRMCFGVDFPTVMFVRREGDQGKAKARSKVDLGAIAGDNSTAGANQDEHSDAVLELSRQYISAYSTKPPEGILQLRVGTMSPFGRVHLVCRYEPPEAVNDIGKALSAMFATSQLRRGDAGGGPQHLDEVPSRSNRSQWLSGTPSVSVDGAAPPANLTPEQLAAQTQLDLHSARSRTHSASEHRQKKNRSKTGSSPVNSCGDVADSAAAAAPSQPATTHYDRQGSASSVHSDGHQLPLDMARPLAWQPDSAPLPSPTLTGGSVTASNVPVVPIGNAPSALHHFVHSNSMHPPTIQEEDISAAVRTHAGSNENKSNTGSGDTVVGSVAGRTSADEQHYADCGQHQVMCIIARDGSGAPEHVSDSAHYALMEPPSDFGGLPDTGSVTRERSGTLAESGTTVDSPQPGAEKRGTSPLLVKAYISDSPPLQIDRSTPSPQPLEHRLQVGSLSGVGSGQRWSTERSSRCAKNRSPGDTLLQVQPAACTGEAAIRSRTQSLGSKTWSILRKMSKPQQAANASGAPPSCADSDVSSGGVWPSAGSNSSDWRLRSDSFGGASDTGRRLTGDSSGSSNRVPLAGMAEDGDLVPFDYGNSAFVSGLARPNAELPANNAGASGSTTGGMSGAMRSPAGSFSTSQRSHSPKRDGRSRAGSLCVGYPNSGSSGSGSVRRKTSDSHRGFPSYNHTPLTEAALAVAATRTRGDSPLADSPAQNSPDQLHPTLDGQPTLTGLPDYCSQTPSDRLIREVFHLGHERAAATSSAACPSIGSHFSKSFGTSAFHVPGSNDDQDEYIVMGQTAVPDNKRPLDSDYALMCHVGPLSGSPSVAYINVPGGRTSGSRHSADHMSDLCDDLDYAQLTPGKTAAALASSVAQQHQQQAPSVDYVQIDPNRSSAMAKALATKGKAT